MLGVVGAGTMGAGIAQVFATFDRPVTLVDVDPRALERATKSIEGSLARLVKKGALDEAKSRAALGRIRTSTTLADLKGAELVVEAVVERFDVKERVFRELDAVCPPAAVLATNTSSISVTRVAACTKRPDKVVGMHFMNPVPVMPLVEVIRAQQTSDDTARLVVELARALGKTPVEVNDSPGFVSNRVLLPMINEAIFCVHEGVAKPEAVDAVMKLGMSHPLGPLALADLIGLDVCLDILDVLHRDLGEDKYRPCPLLRKMVDAGLLGRKSGRGFFVYG
jgi:3-hydroxybutyryl-CoA dehydrogenase